MAMRSLHHRELCLVSFTSIPILLSCVFSISLSRPLKGDQPRKPILLRHVATWLYGLNKTFLYYKSVKYEYAGKREI